MDLVSLAQIAAAIGTLILAILTFAYVLFTRSMVKELRETRIAQDRPQVIVDADYSDRSVINVVVRNIGRGAAKDITFHFSDPLESSMSMDESSDAPPLNELPYFKEGIDYLAPGAEISSLWDSYVGLLPVLEKKGLWQGITVVSKYKSLTEDLYETKWKINPLLVLGKPYVVHKGMNDIANSLDKISRNFARVTRSGELRVSTKTERKQEAEQWRREIEAQERAEKDRNKE